MCVFVAMKMYARVCVRVKNVVHCASTMAIFDVKIVSSVYIFEMDFIICLAARFKFDTKTHFYYVDCVQ